MLTQPLNRCPALSRISLTLDYIFLSLFILALDHLSFGRYAIFWDIYIQPPFKLCEYALIQGKTMMGCFNILFSLISFKTLSHKGEKIENFSGKMQHNCLWEGSLTFWKRLVAIQYSFKSCKEGEYHIISSSQ